MAHHYAFNSEGEQFASMKGSPKWMEAMEEEMQELATMTHSISNYLIIYVFEQYVGLGERQSKVCILCAISRITMHYGILEMLSHLSFFTFL